MNLAHLIRHVSLATHLAVVHEFWNIRLFHRRHQTVLEIFLFTSTPKDKKERVLCPPRSPDLSPADFYMWGSPKGIFAGKESTCRSIFGV